jgi:hypothetical protein
MLNSTTNRLRADFDSRRRSSTGRVSSISTSNNNLRQGKKRVREREREREREKERGRHLFYFEMKTVRAETV